MEELQDLILSTPDASDLLRQLQHLPGFDIVPEYLRGIQILTSDGEGIFGQVTPSQRSNLKRFLAKIPSNVSNVEIKDLPNAGKVFIADSPASNISGSFARYEKQVDSNGKTLQYTKTTFNPDGEIVHVASKYPGFFKIKPGD